jgi:RHS repeat-associated protein
MITRDITTGVISRKLMVRDHLGSVLAITNNAKVERAFYYKAFGEQVDVTEQGFGEFKRYARQGYTGHEMLNGLNIIHMNGRIYDPTLGRFLQADPHIQAASNSQSYNRYSYVLNNPMSYTDPSGYFFKKLGKFVKKYWRVIAAAVVTYFTAGAASGWAASWGFSGAAAGAVSGAIAGAAGGFVATGSLKGAMVGAISGAAFGAIGAAGWNKAGSFAASGAVGGVMSDLQGGKFGHGFWSAGLGSATGGQYSSNAPVQVLVAAVVGGTISKLTGGKFANGAYSAAFAAALRADWGDTKESFSITPEKKAMLTEAELETSKQNFNKIKNSAKVYDKLGRLKEMKIGDKVGGLSNIDISFSEKRVYDDNGQIVQGVHAESSDGWTTSHKVTIYADACSDISNCAITMGHELRHTSSQNSRLPYLSHWTSPGYGTRPGGNVESDAEYYGKWFSKKLGH